MNFVLTRPAQPPNTVEYIFVTWLQWTVGYLLPVWVMLVVLKPTTRVRVRTACWRVAAECEEDWMERCICNHVLYLICVDTACACRGLAVHPLCAYLTRGAGGGHSPTCGGEALGSERGVGGVVNGAGVGW